MTNMMMESFGQTFVVASSVAKDDEYLHQQQQETDEDSGSYDDEEDGHSYDSQEGGEEEDDDDDDESDGSMGGGYLGTAKYFADARCFEPEMMGFSDSFVTDQDCSEKLDFGDEDEDFGSPNASPDSSKRDNNGGMDISRNSMEASVHEDVLSFDKMLGKRQSSSTSLCSTASANDLLQFTVTGAGSSLNTSNRPPSSRGMHSGSKSSRDRSRSRSNSQQRVRKRSTSRSSQDGPPVETARSLMPPDTEDDDHEHDLLSMIPLTGTHQPPQSARPRAMRKKSLGHDDKISSNSASSRGKVGPSRTPPATARTVRSSRRVSEPHHRELEGATPKDERTRRTVGRRGSIENRRQSRRSTAPAPYMDSSSRRSSGGESLDNSNDISQRSSSSRQPSLQRLGSREGIPARTRSLSSSQQGAAERRRSKTGGSLLSPDLIAEKLLTGDMDNEEEEPNQVFDELRRSQVRSMGRRRSTAGCETMGRRKSIGMASTATEPARMPSQKQLSQRQLGTRRTPDDLAASGTTGTKPMRRMSKSADNATMSNSISCPSRALREKRVGVGASATRARVRRHRSTDVLEVSGQSINDDSEVRHDSRRDSAMSRRKMGVKPASYRQPRSMARSRSEPSEVLHNIMYDDHDIDDDTVAAIGPSDTKAKALQRKQAAVAALKAASEGKATSKVLQIQ